jgi:hypothetical protein
MLVRLFSTHWFLKPRPSLLFPIVGDEIQVLSPCVSKDEAGESGDAADGRRLLKLNNLLQSVAGSYLAKVRPPLSFL